MSESLLAAEAIAAIAVMSTVDVKRNGLPSPTRLVSTVVVYSALSLVARINSATSHFAGALGALIFGAIALRHLPTALQAIVGAETVHLDNTKAVTT
jgi:hypothetical protein